jgi:V/A-type H+-transporting ATPase subunit D
MVKIKLTKGELKRQRDALRQYQRYLPTLQLKKQQLQMEILRQTSILDEKTRLKTAKTAAIETWSGLIGDGHLDIRPWLRPKRIISTTRNIAGVDLPVFENVEFDLAQYDLFTAGLWVDAAIEGLRSLVVVREEIQMIKTGTEILRHQLRITAQRVNLFEKVKIPESQEAIRLIKIYIGDQMANAVGRSKMAKTKIEQAELAGALA